MEAHFEKGDDISIIIEKLLQENRISLIYGEKLIQNSLEMNIKLRN